MGGGPEEWANILFAIKAEINPKRFWMTLILPQQAANAPGTKDTL